MDAELEAIGHAPPPIKILHGCRVCVLECPDLTASDDSAARVAAAWGQSGDVMFPELQTLVTKRVALQVSTHTRADTTHCLCRK